METGIDNRNTHELGCIHLVFWVCTFLFVLILIVFNFLILIFTTFGKQCLTVAAHFRILLMFVFLLITRSCIVWIKTDIKTKLVINYKHNNFSRNQQKKKDAAF